MEFSWTAFFVTVGFIALFIVAWLAHKAGPGDED